MTTLVQHFDADQLVQAIRLDPTPDRAATLAAEAVAAALRAYRAPSLEARRLAEEAVGAVKESLAVLAAAVQPAPPPRRPRPAPVTAPFTPPPPPFDVVALAPLACALAALPVQGGPVGSLLVLAAAAASGFVFWRSTHRPPTAAPLLPLVAAPPPEPPPPPLKAETVAAAIGRALTEIDALVANAERRRAARTEPSRLNDTTLEFLQDLAEAALRSRAEFALAKIEFRLPVVLEALDLDAVAYEPGTAAHFDIDGDPALAATRRPAILSGGRCVKRGLATTRPGRAA
jgi:hypothetical protein